MTLDQQRWTFYALVGFITTGIAAASKSAPVAYACGFFAGVSLFLAFGIWDTK